MVQITSTFIAVLAAASIVEGAFVKKMFTGKRSIEMRGTTNLLRDAAPEPAPIPEAQPEPEAQPGSEGTLEEYMRGIASN